VKFENFTKCLTDEIARGGWGWAKLKQIHHFVALDVNFERLNKGEARVKTFIKSKARMKFAPINLLVFVSSLLIQMLFIGKYLDNSIISAYAVTAVDAADYANRAQIWRSSGFASAFSDAYRMPGYPSFILVLSFLFPSHTFLALKILQMFGLALSTVMIKIILEKLVSTRWSLVGSAFFALLPIWHFTPIVLAESFTSTFFIVLVFTLSGITEKGPTKERIFIISVLITILTFLKPNNLLLIIPVLVFLYFKVRHGALRSVGLVIALFVLWLAPWIGYASNSNPGFHGLTTNSGINLYIGTGMIVSYDGGVLSAAAIKRGVDPKSNMDDVVNLSDGLSPVQVNQVFQDRAVEIWRERPIKVFLYGLEKVLIAFGFKANSHLDYLLGIFHLGALIAGAILLKFPNYRIWGTSLLITFFVLAAQAAIFQADRRFIVPVFSSIAVINIILVLSLLSINRRGLMALFGLNLSRKQNGN
jgi:hypothetical protein